jgi:hypothetical protein
MCWECDHPEATHEDYLDMVRECITAHCWHVVSIERDGIHPPWAYSVGLTGHGKPEVVVTGMPLRRAVNFVNVVADHVHHAEAPLPGTQVQWIDGPLTEFVRIPVPDAHLFTAVDIYGPDIRALQVVHADDRGRWPWETGYRGVRGGQPVLGPREPAERRVRVA